MRKFWTIYVLLVLGGITLVLGPDFWIEAWDGFWEAYTTPPDQRTEHTASRSLSELTPQEIPLVVAMFAVFIATLMAPVVLLWNMVHGVRTLFRRKEKR